MTATDELRARLDTRGIDWDFGPSGPYSTAFRASGMELSFVDWEHGLLCSTIFTPAQAIEATLGCEVCHDMCTDDDEWFACSECNTELRVHEPFGVMSSIRYCPNCGRRVVEVVDA